MTIFYNGTPMGGSRDQTALFLQGENALVSFFRPDDMPVVLECCQSFVLDNGAWSHAQNARKHNAKHPDRPALSTQIDFYEYVKWVNEYRRHPAFQWCLIPDVIDGSEEENVDLVNRWVRSGYKAKGVPVWHMHESLEWLDYLVSNFEWVALGSSGIFSRPNSRVWWRRMAEAMAVACDSYGRPRCKLHGLRMMNPEVFTRLPLASVDSTNAAVNSGAKDRFGMYVPPTRAQRAAVLAARVKAHSGASFWGGVDIDGLYEV